MPGIVDFHTHAFPDSVAPNVVLQLEKHYGAVINNKGTRRELEEQRRRAGIAACLISTAATVPQQVIPANKWAVSIQREGGQALGTIHPDFPCLEEQLNFLAQGGIKGIKIHPELQGLPLDDPRFFPLWELIGDRFFVLIHLGEAIGRPRGYASPDKLARVLALFPRLRAIGAHLGGFGMWQQAKETLIGGPCYLDTSSTIGYLPGEEIVGIIRAHGVEKVVFGSDYPVRSPEEELELFWSLPLTARERELILMENSGRLLAGEW